MKEGLINRIRTVGHWRVNLRPLQKIAEQLSFQQCFEEVDRSRVSLRGWDFPHISHRNDEQGGSARVEEYYENWTDWYTQVEFWRMYKSGQFLSYNVLGNDIEGPNGEQPDDRTLDITDAIYSLTEFIEFAHRLTANGLYKYGVVIDISLNKTEQRRLLVGPRRMPFFDKKESGAPSIKIKRILAPTDWEGGPIQIALGALLKLFDHFGWNPQPSQIRADQESLYRRG